MSDQGRLRAVKLRIYPNKAKQIALTRNIGCCRWVYNYFLEKRIKYYEKTGETLSYSDCSKKLTKLKRRYLWLRDADAQSLQQSLKDMDQAYQNFFKHGRGFPKFKKRGQKDSLRLPQRVDYSEGKLRLGKHGWITCRGSTERLKDKHIRQITVSYEAGQWFASCLTEVEKTNIEHPYPICGVDVGVTKPLVIAVPDEKDYLFCQSGKDFKKKLRKKEQKRKREQSKLARKQKKSKNRIKQRLSVARAFQRERNLRKEWVEQTSHRLTRLFHTVVFENLNMKGMTKAAKGTMENPGVNVRAKSGLNRELLRLGISHLMTRCQQKAELRGGNVVFVDPRYTSQTCSCCGHTHKNNRKNQAVFKCQKCGHTENADRNAAVNILLKAA